jgi:hypothetical protein
MSMRIGVLSNLRAGRDHSRLAKVLRELERHPDVLHLEADSSDLVPDALDQFANEGVELLVVNGGDGTVQHALTEILSAPRRSWLPLIAPIRGGRTNMVALDLGARRNPARALRELIVDARAGRVAERIVQREVLRVDLGPEIPIQYGMFFGVGMLYRAIHATHRAFPEGKAQGVFGAAIVTGTLVTRAATGDRAGILDADKMQIALDETPLAPDGFILAMATTLERLFLRMRPFWGVEAAPIHITTIAAGARVRASTVAGILRGRPPSHATPEAGFTSRNVHKVALRLDCGTTLDGELFGPESGRLVSLSSADRVRFVRA